MVYLVRNSHDHTHTHFSAGQSLSRLRSRFQTDGIEGFTEEKNALRAELKSTLSEEPQDSEDSERATQMATYLFPDILPDNNFEKPIGLDLWAPLEKQIEEHPRTPASREKFEELRATLWNYESPDRKSPEISENAEEVLRIYDTLSSP